jgi:hypothetical protein
MVITPAQARGGSIAIEVTAITGSPFFGFVTFKVFSIGFVEIALCAIRPRYSVGKIRPDAACSSAVSLW